jgi:hypothetical protein
MWIIKNSKGLCWSNDWGWGSRKGCEVFSENERKRLNLPVGGFWVMISPWK